MLFADEHKLLEACARCMKDINDVEAYDELMIGLPEHRQESSTVIQPDAIGDHAHGLCAL